MGCALVAPAAFAADHLVTTPAAYAQAVKRAAPGDRILLADGVWRDFQIIFAGRGTADKPITLTAQTPGKVILSGRSNLRIGGAHLIVSNLVFRDGWSPTKELIALRVDSKTVANNTRLTGIVVDRFTNPDRRAQDIWVAIYGTDNRVDHSWFAGKGNGGVTLAVIRPKGQPGENRARIDHNFFGPRPPLGSNGGETIRIGTSDESLSDSKSTVENNWFEGCDGEVEIVSVKSGGNVIRGNMVVESQGAIVLRHGNGNLVERNIFLGRGKPSTGGIRVINRDQVVRHNYLENVTGTSFLSAIAVMNGVPNSTVNRYHQVANALIERNTIIDAARITFGAGADAERSAPPVSSRFANNLIYTASGKSIVRVDGDASGIAMTGNVQSGPPPKGLAGFVQADIKLVRAANGLLYPADPALAATGAPRDLVMLKREDAGPAWYPKDAPASVGRTLDVAPGALAQAIAASGPGDTIRVAPGIHRVTVPIPVGHSLTVSGPRTAILESAAPTLFQLTPGGSLYLSGVTLSGAASPTAGRASLIRAPQSVSILNYRVTLSDVAVRDAVDVIATTPDTFAEDVAIRRSTFAKVSGAVVAAAAETGSKGLYSAERITIADSDFTDVATIADVARLGTDESTFGPWFVMTGNRIINDGAVRLSGVQNVAITGNRFERAKAIAIANSVGAPVVRITANVFAATPEPTITRLYPQGTPDIVLADNQMEALR
ncbi:poly(beta-D-mannuronate) lyase [Sphingomonas suaedae]|uniref:Poly(Beta-D-mannuronate) lyase n=2 Tax=Sphingomonas suaedae TaxID=2599297 RepID=A0A518RKX5_9SPHN|nr:poly(beta-D-mannuronate) lyase [Sphingomonas suaedae]